jgi:hypothetical protein
VAEHGTTLDGYRERYARLNASDPDQVEQIWRADTEYLEALEALEGELGDETKSKGLAQLLNPGDVITIRARKFTIVMRPTGASSVSGGNLEWESLTLVLERVPGQPGTNIDDRRRVAEQRSAGHEARE